VEVRAGGQAGVAHQADALAAAHHLTLLDVDLGHVPEAAKDAETVIQNDYLAPHLEGLG
jgi:hypothetical protein